MYEGLLEMGGPHGDQTFDYSPVLPLLDELRAAAPPALAEELRAAVAFLGERHPPPIQVPRPRSREEDGRT
jgi:hypothetical protein